MTRKLRQVGSVAVAVAAIVAAAAAGAIAWQWTNATTVVTDAIPAVGGPFTLTDSAGHAVSDRDFRGKWMVLYFGYTFCPDACPLALTNIAGALQALGAEAARIQPIFITIDPQRDTPQVMGEYVKTFDPRIIGLSGSPAAVGAVAKEFRVYYEIHPPTDGSNDYLVDHSSYFYVVDPQGKFVRPLAGDAPPEEIATQLRSLLGKTS